MPLQKRLGVPGARYLYDIDKSALCAASKFPLSSLPVVQHSFFPLSTLVVFSCRSRPSWGDISQPFHLISQDRRRSSGREQTIYSSSHEIQDRRNSRSQLHKWTGIYPSQCRATIHSRDDMNNGPHSLNLHPGTVTVFTQAREWLDSCAPHHDVSRALSPEFVSTRLPHISPEESEVTCHLTEILSQKLKNYAALSYLWGGDQAFKTTLETIARYNERITPDGAVSRPASWDLRYLPIESRLFLD